MKIFSSFKFIIQYTFLVLYYTSFRYSKIMHWFFLSFYSVRKIFKNWDYIMSFLINLDPISQGISNSVICTGLIRGYKCLNTIKNFNISNNLSNLMITWAIGKHQVGHMFEIPAIEPLFQLSVKTINFFYMELWNFCNFNFYHFFTIYR